MRNIILPFILLLVLFSAVLFGAANKIGLSATVGSKALVGFNDLSTSTDKGSLFVDDSLNQLNFGTQSAGVAHSPLIRSVYVSTNNKTGVNMIIQDMSNNGSLVHSSGDRITMNYSFDGQPIQMGIPFQITSSTNNGSTPVGNMRFEPGTTSKENASGTYSTTLSVIISAN